MLACAVVASLRLLETVTSSVAPPWKSYPASSELRVNRPASPASVRRGVSPMNGKPLRTSGLFRLSFNTSITMFGLFDFAKAGGTSEVAALAAPGASWSGLGIAPQ